MASYWVNYYIGINGDQWAGSVNPSRQHAECASLLASSKTIYRIKVTPKS